MSQYRVSFLFVISLSIFNCSLQYSNADVVPEWNDTSPIEVSLEGSSATYEASGTVELGTLDAILVYDISSSMDDETGQTAPNGGTERGDWAEAGAMAFVDALPDSARLGLNSFAGSSSVVVPLNLLGESGSDHRTTLNEAIDSMPRNGGSTNIANGIELAASLLNDSSVNSDSKHIVVLTDGEQNSGDAVAAAEMALIFGIDTVNTVGLPGADTSLLADVAAAGNGAFVDGTDLSTLIEDFENILSEAETLDKLEVLRDGELIGELAVNSNGEFSVALEVFAGDNLFTARATSNLGNVRESNLLIRGITAVPEPTSSILILAFAGCGILQRRRT